MAKNTYKQDEVLEEPFDIKHLLRASSYIKKYALCQKSIQLKRANYFTHWNYGTKKFKKNH